MESDQEHEDMRYVRAQDRYDALEEEYNYIYSKVLSVTIPAASA